MKKIFFIFFMAFVPLFALADSSKEPIFGKYGFQSQVYFERFQKYVGKTVVYLPCQPLSYLESNVFKTEKFVPGAEYVILEIKPKSGEVSYEDITITFQEKGGKNKLKMKTFAHRAYQFPFFFIDDFNADKPSLIGKEYKDPAVKGAYTITDVKLEKPETGDRIMEPVYYVSNPELNISFKTTNVEEMVKACLNEDKSGAYHSTLVKVEKPENASEKYGEVKTINEQGLTKYSFEDELISIIIFGGSTQFNFKLTNKSQNSIKLIWDDAVFVDYTGSTSKIMHAGIKYSQREASQPASTIIRGASLEDIACPICNVRYSDVLHEWITDSMYPKHISQGVKQIRLMLPIQIKDVVNEYVFVFDVEYISNHPERLSNDNGLMKIEGKPSGVKLP